MIKVNSKRVKILMKKILLLLFVLILLMPQALPQSRIRKFGKNTIIDRKNSTTIVRKFGTGYISETRYRTGKYRNKTETIRPFGSGYLSNEVYR